MMSEFKKDISNIDDLKKVSKILVKKLKEPQIVCLRGPLGSGKSQMIRFMVKELGVCDEEVHSPSFSLINIYEGRENRIYHIDLFRLKNIEDLKSINFWDIFLNKSHLVFIEWSELFENELPQWNKLFLDFFFKDSRRILKYHFEYLS